LRVDERKREVGGIRADRSCGRAGVNPGRRLGDLDDARDYEHAGHTRDRRSAELDQAVSGVAAHRMIAELSREERRGPRFAETGEPYRAAWIGVSREHVEERIADTRLVDVPEPLADPVGDVLGLPQHGIERARHGVGECTEDDVDGCDRADLRECVDAAGGSPYPCAATMASETRRALAARSWTATTRHGRTASTKIRA
jgi:hypothetical protein